MFIQIYLSRVQWWCWHGWAMTNWKQSQNHPSSSDPSRRGRSCACLLSKTQLLFCCVGKAKSVQPLHPTQNPLGSSLPTTWSTILIPCPIVGHSKMTNQNSSKIPFPLLPSALVATCHWSPLQSAFCPLSKLCPICTQRGMYRAVSWKPQFLALVLILIWSASGRTILVRSEDDTTDQAPFEFEIYLDSLTELELKRLWLKSIKQNLWLLLLLAKYAVPDWQWCNGRACRV